MIAVIQRVRECSVLVDDKRIGKINNGILVLLGVAQDDESKDADYLADKIIQLRIFEDDQGKMNRSLIDINGEIIVVSQFTLLGDCKKGRRPSFAHAAKPDHAEFLYEYFIEKVKSRGIKTQTGSFGAMMDVSLINNGPVTFIIHSK